MAAGAPELLLPIVADFLASGNASLDTLHAALAAGDLPAAQGVLHQIKGASGTMGLLQFRELCAECEGQVKAGSAPARVGELRPLLQQSVEAATQHLGGG